MAMTGGNTRCRAGGANRPPPFRKTEPAGIKAYIIDLGQIEEGSLGNPQLIGGDTVHVVQSGTIVFFDRIWGKLSLGSVAF